MIFCNGCSKTGTHILTSFVKALGYPQIGGTIIKRTPKSSLKNKGSTLLKEVFEKDNQYYIHAHMAYTQNLSVRISTGQHKHLFIIRDPRNVAVSWMRHRIKQLSGKGEQVLPSKQFLEQIIRGKMFNMPVAKYYGGFTPWIGAPNTLCIRFEYFFEHFDNVADDIVNYLAANKRPSRKEVYGKSTTYTGSWSEWQDWWSEDIQRAWRDTGGDLLTYNLGYQ